MPLLVLPSVMLLLLLLPLQALQVQLLEHGVDARVQERRALLDQPATAASAAVL